MQMTINNSIINNSIKTIPPDTLGQYTIERNDTHVRRDIYRFMNYIFEHGLQRSYRANQIPKGPAKKLAKILSYQDELASIEEDNCGYWSDFISQLLMGMKLVTFDTKGEYMGYSSSELSYRDNFIKPCRDAWEKYLRLSSLDKEWAILGGLNTITENEFHHDTTLLYHSRRFAGTGSAINAASKMNLPKIRSALLDILSQLKPDVWYSLPDLTAYLKENQFNLIIDHSRRDNYTKENIYHCFFEYPIKDGDIEWKGREIQERQPDAFERVEGRYLTFFFEEIPFLMGFVNLAYDKDLGAQTQSVSPYYGYLKAFSLTPKFFTVYGKDTSYNKTTITVQANHEVVVQYSGYAETQLQLFQKYGKLLKDDQSLIFCLEKKRVADRVAAGEDIESIIRELRVLSSSPIPQNIITEMESWGSYGEKITLYRGYSLLEVEREKLQELSHSDKPHSDKPHLDKPHLDKPILDDIEKSITPNIFLISSGEHIFQYLENHGYLPIKFQHHQKAFFYSHKTHSTLKGISVEKEKKADCEVSFREFAGLYCAKSEILAQVEQQLQKKEIQTYLFPQANLLLVPAAFMKPLETIAEKVIEKGDMEMKIIG